MVNRIYKGFALPSIMIASVVMLMVLVAAISAVSTTRAALTDQYYNQLAKEAAESGLVLAGACVDYESIIWTDSSPLRPGSGCDGRVSDCDIPGDTTRCYVYLSSSLRLSFVVGEPTAKGNYVSIDSIGRLEQLRASSGAAWRVYEQKVSMNIEIEPDVFSVVLGYAGVGTCLGVNYITINNSGSAMVAGANGCGQLGNGSTVESLVPMRYSLPNGVIAVSASTNFVSLGSTLSIIGSDRQVYSSGANHSGQIGNGTHLASQSAPSRFILPTGVSAKHVYAHGRSTYVVASDNNIYTAGDNTNGLLGIGGSLRTSGSPYAWDSGDVDVPQRVLLPTPASLTASQINAYRQDVSSGNDPGGVKRAQLNTIPSTFITGDSTSIFVIMEGGALYGWGGNYWAGNPANDIGTGAPGPFATTTPVRIGTYGDIGQPGAVYVSHNGGTTLVVDSNGGAACTGYVANEHCGRGSSAHSTSLVSYQLPPSATPGSKIVKFQTDQTFSVALTDTGEVWGTGQNNWGQLGDGTTVRRTTPVRFILPHGVQAVDIWVADHNNSSGLYSNTFVVGSDGKVYGAGTNSYGQLGNGCTYVSPIPTVSTTGECARTVAYPVAMSGIGGMGGPRAQAVRSGYGTTVIYTDSFRVYSVGRNSWGQLGNGSTEDTSTPSANKYLNERKRLMY